jgi:hypothetical protein
MGVRPTILSSSAKLIMHNDRTLYDKFVRAKDTYLKRGMESDMSQNVEDEEIEAAEEIEEAAFLEDPTVEVTIKGHPDAIIAFMHKASIGMQDEVLEPPVE